MLARSVLAEVSGACDGVGAGRVDDTTGGAGNP